MHAPNVHTERANEGSARRMRYSPWGRRVRAAMALAERDVNALAPELNVSTKTFLRTLRGERAPREWETRRLAELLDVSEAFLRGQVGIDADHALLDDLLFRLKEAELVLEMA